MNRRMASVSNPNVALGSWLICHHTSGIMTPPRDTGPSRDSAMSNGIWSILDTIYWEVKSPASRTMHWCGKINCATEMSLG